MFCRFLIGISGDGVMEDSLLSSERCHQKWKKSLDTVRSITFQVVNCSISQNIRFIYKEIARLMQFSTLSYVLRKDKEIVGEQGVTGYNGVHAKHIPALHNILVIDSARIHGVISFDKMKIKDGIAWDINST